MNPEQINRLIAESGLFKYPDIVPMGGKWRIHKPDTPYYQEYYEDFDPYHNPTHAHMALEMIRCQGYWIHLFGRPEHWSCGMAHLTDTSKRDVLQKADTPSAAICAALLEAVKGE
jgi:hypothetical protein